MTKGEIKRLDRKIRDIQDPLGAGYPLLYSLFQQTALEKGTSKWNICREYMDWKLFCSRLK